MSVDADEAQLARIDALRSPARGLFVRSYFQIEYTRVSKGVWFPASSCNVLSGETVGAKVSFQNTGLREIGKPNSNQIACWDKRLISNRLTLPR